MKSIRLLIILSVSCVIAFAQNSNIPDEVTKVATAAENWLKLETSARAIGMGGAQVAAGQGIDGIPYNPASLGFITGNELYFSKVNYLAGISHNVLSFGTKLSETDYFALHLFFLDSGPIEVTDSQFPLGTGEDYHVRDLAFRITYAKILTDRLKVGLTVKYIREDIYTMYAQTFAVDIGSNFDTGIYGMKLGMSVSNFGPEIQYHGEGLESTVPDTTDPSGAMAKITEKFPLPMTFRLGISNDIIGTESYYHVSNTHRLTLAVDGMNPMDYVVTINAGLEYAWRETAFARIGYHFDHDTGVLDRGNGLDEYPFAGLSLGAGARISTNGLAFTIDYAFVNYGILDFTHQFSIKVNL